LDVVGYVIDQQLPDANMRIRKQVYELTVEDFDQHPVWEFALDEEGEEGQDEATVRPIQLTGPVNPADGMVVVKARFTLADGTLMAGYLTPPIPHSGDLSSIQPQIITQRGQVSFWCGAFKPTSDQLAQNYGRLGRTAHQIFPLRFTSEIKIIGGPVTGILNGFLYRELTSERVYEIL
jgi:hypothetical protein